VPAGARLPPLRRRNPLQQPAAFGSQARSRLRLRLRPPAAPAAQAPARSGAAPSGGHLRLAARQAHRRGEGASIFPPSNSGPKRPHRQGGRRVGQAPARPLPQLPLPPRAQAAPRPRAAGIRGAATHPCRTRPSARDRAAHARVQADRAAFLPTVGHRSIAERAAFAGFHRQVECVHVCLDSSMRRAILAAWDGAARVCRPAPRIPAARRTVCGLGRLGGNAKLAAMGGPAPGLADSTSA